MPNDLSPNTNRSVPAKKPNPESFFGDVIGALAGTLEDVVGLEDAAGFVARVGNELGRDIGDSYRDENGHLPADLEGLVNILTDLKTRIGGEFVVDHVDAEKICLSTTKCPFARRVQGRPSLCMMTTNVFGRIAADALGYASVRVEDSQAVGHSCCRVTVNLNKDSEVDAYEFFG
ncbi:MAG: methanogen output domain 1-containing protein [Pelagimonas sp.]|jgi:predicted ArsR family transcriptional regulator|nr:methanogen output domain 1-containing protein [Pelagimonas sp.]